ncbi:MAG: hypothetical protein NT027_19030 [Proteobacteria bacterium]|nr:hypothetical protein [Pseudomonadota bacterium]
MNHNPVLVMAIYKPKNSAGGQLGVSEAAAKRSHDHPAVAKIWEAMAKVCDFGTLNQLPESQKVFPQFQSAF